MRRWFLSYNSQDLALMQAFEAALRRKDADAYVFFAPRSLRAGGYWLPEVAKEIAEATAFVLLVGANGLGSWQVAEYYEALDRRVKEPNFPVVLVLLDGQPAPGLPFLRQLHWIVTADPTAEQSLAKLMEAAAGSGGRPGELWRYTAPYRGLAAMTETDSDFFFGRTQETVEVIRVLEATPDKLPVLLGNSGVGKSSLAQAGVMAAFARQAWPDDANAGLWPRVFRDSRQWCFLTMRPGAEPLKALVEAFLETWQFNAGDAARVRRRTEWVELLLDGGKTRLVDLLDETERRYRELGRSKPPAFLLYIDQGEELYVRGEQRQRRRFSDILARGLGDPRLRALMSLRADFSGALQIDQPLFDVYQRIEVPPLREPQLHEVVSRPAALLSARFENGHLAADIARRAAEESTKDAGALPLLSYLLDDMWRCMVEHGDGILRLPAQSIDIGRVLVDRANAFIVRHPHSEEKLRRIFTLKLATVREDGEPTRRRARRSEFSEEEWRLVSELADHPNRLLVTATQELGAPLAPQSADAAGNDGSTAGETFTEVAHEAIFRRWDKLREWIASEREFLAWRSGLEVARRAWQGAPERSKAGALLMGLALARAQSWLARRPEDIPEADRHFIVLSRKAARRGRLRVRALVGALAFGILVGTIGWINQTDLREWYYWRVVMGPTLLDPGREQALRSGGEFKECRNGCPSMVVVPAGTFTMGAPEEKGGSSERPQHQVTFDRPFAVGKNEVTFAEWDVCVAAGACERVRDLWGREDMPTINVSWDNAKQYVAWLKKTTGKDYRLLTEAEWEYAARAGSDTDYSWGDDVQVDGKAMANCELCGSKWDAKQPAPVGQFPGNAFGLHDMHGNVWEWVEDNWHENYEGAPSDGKAWMQGGDASRRVARGGGWQNNPRFLRSAVRNWVSPVDRSPYVGLRVARTLGP